MEQPPGGLNDLQVQDLSTTSIPAVLDLTSKADLNNKSKDALRVVRCPGWHQSTGTNNTSISCSKTADVALQPATQVKPDNAFSHTTVTLSYVSRSHIYPSVDAPCEDSSLRSAPPDGSLSLLPPCENGYRSLHSAGLAVTPGEAQQTFRWLNGEGVEGCSETTGEKHAISPEMGRIAGEDTLAKSSSKALKCFTEKDKKTKEINVPLLPSLNQNCVTIPDNIGARELCSLRKNFTSPLEEPLSPSATVLDDMEDVFILPQPSSSPRAVSSFQEAANAITGTTDVQSSGKDFTDETQIGTVEEDDKLKVDENAKTHHTNCLVKKLPVRSGRGMRLETMDSDSSAVVSQQVPCNTRKASHKKGAADKPIEKVTLATGILLTDTQTDTLKKSTSDSEVTTLTDEADASLSTKTPQDEVDKTLSESLSSPASPVAASKTSPPTSRAAPKKQSRSPRGKATPQRRSTTPKKKTAKTPRRQRKRLKQSPSSSMFAPKEPDIRLKYVNYKEEKRDSRVANFSPFIHVERRPSSAALCTVVNEPEEMNPQQKSQRQQSNQAGAFVSATVPSTSCLQLGRVSNHGQNLRPFVCCLCQRPSNALDLGDLLGPYYSEGYQPGSSAPSCTPGLQEDSDSDSSYSSRSAKRRKRTVPNASRPHRLTMKHKHEGPLQICHLTEDDSSSPAAKRPRSDMGTAEQQDWFSPPQLPMQSCEYWLHEDCGIWAAEVFVVKGKVYGLEEAVKVAQATVCSACCSPGATLGCFFKGCPNKYHYRCALQSDCILIEENFSMKCKKHKNKTLNGPLGKHLNKR